MTRTSLLLALLFLARTDLAFAAFPYRVGVEVSFADERSSERLREDVLRATREELRERGCFATAEEGSSADLRLSVALRDARDETNYDDSLAGHLDSNDPEARLRYTVVLSTFVTMDLSWLPEGGTVRSGRFRAQADRRPLFLGEDSRRIAHEELVRNIAHRLASWTCGISRKKLEAARAGATSAR